MSALGGVARALRLLGAEIRSIGDRAGRVFPEGETEGGSLRYHGPLPILDVAGSPYRMGLAHGRLLADQIRRLSAAYFDVFFGSYSTRGSRAEFDAISERLGASIPPRHEEELRGLAEGAGIPYRDALFLQTFLDIHKLYFCSTTAVRTPRGRLVLGRNLDFPSLGLAHRYGLVAVWRGDGLRPVVSVGWPGMIGSLTGMNDAGLTLAVMVVYLVEDVRRGIPYTIQFRRALEEEGTVDGLAARLATEGSTNSNNLLVADGAGAAALLEIRPGAVERFDRGDGTICATNHFRGAGRRPFTWHPQYLSSYVRRGRLVRDRRADAGRATAADVRRSLRAVAPPLGNMQSMLLYPEERAMAIAMGGVPAARGSYAPLPAAVTFGRRRGG